jgi:hypothetical protein
VRGALAAAFLDMVGGLGNVKTGDFQRQRCFCKAWSGLQRLNFIMQSREGS